MTDDSRPHDASLTACASSAANHGSPDDAGAGPIAIVGMAGIFPGANTLDAFWRMLSEGRDGLSPAFEEQGPAGPIAPINRAFKDSPEFVSRVYGLPEKARFDAAFFGISPREAEIMDPQHRLFLETAWTALEHACVIPDETTVPVGVYAACGFNAYLFNNLPGVLSAHSPMSRYLEVLVGNDKDYLATRVSYKLKLTGPSLVVQSACSSSLTAVILACQGLRDYQCDMALAGGSSIQMNQDGGYLPEDGSPLSHRGATRAFDAEADGVAGGSGCAAVVLKRYEDALADGDVIYAVIRGHGLNNDGADKVHFTAPSVGGQAKAIAEAIAEAGIQPTDIGYIECHGTGTILGDPIEIAGLNKALGLGWNHQTRIPIGSVKTNVGHLDTAAGVTALIKAALALHRESIPPSLNFSTPNPKIDFDATPFEVCTAPRPWPRAETPRYAAVSSFGFGGTNTHVILSEGPPPAPVTTDHPVPVILPISARDDAGVTAAAHRLAETTSKVGLDRLAAVLQRHRKRFSHRGAVVARTLEEARTVLAGGAFTRGQAHPGAPRVVFMFPGQGCQYPGMAEDLYAQGGVFTETLDRLLTLALEVGRHDLRPLLFPSPDRLSDARAAIDQTEITHLVVFITEYALAHHLMTWGIRPQAVLGHSLGEYAAACLAGVMSEADALRLVARRGALSASLAFNGAMISVPLSRAALAAYPTDALDVAVENGPERLTLTGPRDAIDTLAASLQAQGIERRILRISNAFHCRVLDPILDDFRAAVAAVPMAPPTLPLLSNSSGTYAEADDIVTPDYWVRQFRQAVLFSANLETVTKAAPDDGTILVEVGPGTTLTTLARQHPVIRDRGTPILNLLPDANSHAAGACALHTTLEGVAALWTLGVEVDWSALPHPPQGKAGLPGYPFAGERHWHQPTRLTSAPNMPKTDEAAERASVDDWFMAPTWVRAPHPSSVVPPADETWLILTPPGDGKDDEHGTALATLLRTAGTRVVVAEIGDTFECRPADRFTLRPGIDEDMAALIRALANTGRQPDTVVSLWPLALAPSATSQQEPGDPLAADRLAEARRLCLDPTVSLMRHLAAHGTETARFVLTGRAVFDVIGESPDPAVAGLAAPLLAAAWEHPGFTGIVVDIGDAVPDLAFARRLLTEHHEAVTAVHNSRNGGGQARAWRGETRWVRDYIPMRVPAQKGIPPTLSGPALITGGLGGVGLAYARLLARRGASPLVLVGRTAPPPRDTWSQAEPRSMAAALLDIERSTGAALHPVALDCANAEAMAALITHVQHDHGPLCGVVHAAGVPGGGMIATGLPQGADSNIHSKIAGLAALDQVLASTPLAFFHLTSSLGAVQGAIGQTDNCAANLVMDSFAAWARRHRPWTITAINWDRWQGIGMAKAMEDRHAAMTGHALRSAMTEDDALEAADRLLGHPAPQVLVGNRNPFALAKILQRGEPEAGSPSTPEAETEAPIRFHDRPALSVPYRAPQTETERLLVDLWSHTLGLSPIGVDDGFTQLGGDSLLAIALMRHTRNAFRMDIPLRTLFEVRTIARLAAWLVDHEPKPGFAEKIATAVRRIRATPETSPHQSPHTTTTEAAE